MYSGKDFFAETHKNVNLKRLLEYLLYTFLRELYTFLCATLDNHFVVAAAHFVIQLCPQDEASLDIF